MKLSAKTYKHKLLSEIIIKKAFVSMANAFFV